MTCQRCASVKTCLTLTMPRFVCVEVLLYSDTTKLVISRLKFCKWCVLTSRRSRFSKKLLGKCCRGTPTRPPTCGWISVRARGSRAREQSAFFVVRVCHPSADSYKNLTPKQIYKLHENDKKRLYSSRALEVERGTFTTLVFTTTGGMSDECQLYHSRLAELLQVTLLPASCVILRMKFFFNK